MSAKSNTAANDPDMFSTGGTDEMLESQQRTEAKIDALTAKLDELTDLVVKMSIARPAPAAAAATAGASADGKTFDAKVALFMEEAKPKRDGGTWTQCTATFIPLKNGVLDTAQPWRRTFGKFPGPSTEIATTLDKAFKAGSMVRVHEAPSKKDPKYHDIVRVEVL